MGSRKRLRVSEQGKFSFTITRDEQKLGIIPNSVQFVGDRGDVLNEYFFEGVGFLHDDAYLVFTISMHMSSFVHDVH